MIRILAFLFLPVIVFSALGIPHGAVLAVCTSAALLWLTEALPLPVTGLLIPVLLTIFGAVPSVAAFRPFGSDILYLFAGCFLLGRAIEKHGFDKRMAYFLLSRCLITDRLRGIHVIITVLSFSLSMWISNTSAAVIVSSMTIGILALLAPHLSDPEVRRSFDLRLLLSCACGASIGGLATPIGSPPNLIAVRFLAQRNIEISFIDWMATALPISLLMLVALFFLLEFRYPLKDCVIPSAREIFRKHLKELGPLSRAERQVAIVFGFAVVFWILPSLLTTLIPGNPIFELLEQRLTMATVGLLAGISLFILPLPTREGLERNLTWEDGATIDWGTLMLFGGGLALGDALESTGAARMLGDIVFSPAARNIAILGSFIILGSILFSEFASNTAAASVLIPVILGAIHPPIFSDQTAQALVLACAFSASFGFMLPVSTPPNAIIYGTGRVPAREMLKTGALFDLCGAVILSGYFFIYGLP